MRRCYYAVYLRKTDELVCSGTVEECAAQMGRSIGSFKTLLVRVRSGKNRKYELYQEPYEEQ